MKPCRVVCWCSWINQQVPTLDEALRIAYNHANNWGHVVEVIDSQDSTEYIEPFRLDR